MQIDGTHSITLLEKEFPEHEHVCKKCGACTGHTPALLGKSCQEVIGGAYRIFVHQEIIPSMGLAKLREKLNGGSDGTDEDEAKFIFELRRTALRWAERNINKPVQPSRLQQFVEETENFLRTGQFRTRSSAESEAVKDLATALVQTRDYVQPMVVLHANEGWSWYDALKKHAPDILQQALESDARVHAANTAERDENEETTSNG